MGELRMKSGALFSDDRTYRYVLWRRWSDFGAPVFVVIGLNPSTADETQDDPTIRRCVAFAKREGCGGLAMLNLFAVRATDPKVMLTHPSPVGPENDKYLERYVYDDRVAVVVAAWGAHGSHRRRGEQIAARFPSLRCFGVTKSGHPKHPLYLAANTPIVPYVAPVAPPPETETPR